MSRATRTVVALDGPSGIGKSTYLAGLAQEFSGLGIPVVTWQNANDDVFGPLIREMASSGRNHLTLTLSLAAARARLLETDLDATLILCDRFAVSSLVYQVYAGVPPEYVLAVNAPFLEQVTSIVLTADEQTLNTRRAARAGATDWFKRSLPVKEEISLYQSAYQLLADRSFPVMAIDASPPSPGVTLRKLTKAVRTLLSKNAPLK